MDGSIVVEIRGRAKPGRREDLFAVYEKHVAPNASSNADLSFAVWAADEADADAFVLYEIFDNREAMQATSKTDWFAAYSVEAGPMLDGPPAVLVMQPRWKKSARA